VSEKNNDSKCKPNGNCWCMDIPYKLEVRGDKCLSPKDLFSEIKKEYNLNDEQIKDLKRTMNEKNKSI
tara:strand:+ start:4794 stop:4997 length:204 start_codon:yes stop_codon:yes gene_type:complete